jgi:DNA-3-methyladenine glycosylase I
MKRCKWVDLNNELYVKYHDEEWGVASKCDHHLFEMLVLESFHCGLSWLIVLKKRDNFRAAFDNFDAHLIKDYDEVKIAALLENKAIIRHAGKIKATINNAKRFLEVEEEFKSFANYLWSFTNNKVVINEDDSFGTKSSLSDQVAKDLKKRGFKFMGSVTVQSYLEAVGIINNHSLECFKHPYNN